jgi:cell division protein FtsA
MGVFGFMKKRPAVNQSAISLDIGTEFVKALIFSVDADGIGHVKGVGRQHQKLSDMQGGTITDIAGVIANCERALEQAAEQAGFLPDHVIMGIAGELVKGTTTAVTIQRPQPTIKITLTELQKIIGDVQKRAFDKAREIIGFEAGMDLVDVRLVNAAIVDVTIDGYRVANPIGFQGKEVKVGVFNAFAPLVHLGAYETVAEELKLDLLSVAAEPYAVSRLYGPETTQEFSAIFMDIGGGTTDIAVVQNGGVVGTKMFAIGGRAFTKRIAQVLGVSFAEAERIKINYSHGKTNLEDTELIKHALASDCNVWLSGVELTLSEFMTNEHLPSRILLCGGGSALPEIRALLKNGDWYESLQFTRRPSVSLIHPSEVGTIMDETGKLTEPQDITPMALAHLAAELVDTISPIDSILSKVSTGMRD